MASMAPSSVATTRRLAHSALSRSLVVAEAVKSPPRRLSHHRLPDHHHPHHRPPLTHPHLLAARLHLRHRRLRRRLTP